MINKKSYKISFEIVQTNIFAILNKLYFYSEKAVTAFTPFSVVLGGILSALHNSLKLALSEEQSLPVIIQILKCCSALIQSTPYHRLESGLITNLVCVIKRFTKHKGALQTKFLPNPFLIYP